MTPTYQSILFPHHENNWECFFFWKSWIRCWHLISVSFWWTKDDDKTILKWVWLKQRYDNTNTWEFCLWWEMNLIWMWLYFLTLRLSEEKYANFDQVDHVSPLVCTDRVNEGIWLRDEQKRFHLLERQWMMKDYVRNNQNHNIKIHCVM